MCNSIKYWWWSLLAKIILTGSEIAAQALGKSTILPRFFKEEEVRETETFPPEDPLALQT
jgi:hypothetical protein